MIPHEGVHPGSHRPTCSYSSLTEDRRNTDLRKKMQDKELIMKKKMEANTKPDKQQSPLQMALTVEEMVAFRKEFMEFKAALIKSHP